MSFQRKLGPQSMSCTYQKPSSLENINILTSNTDYLTQSILQSMPVYHNSYSTKVSCKFFANFCEVELLLRIYSLNITIILINDSFSPKHLQYNHCIQVYISTQNIHIVYLCLFTGNLF